MSEEQDHDLTGENSVIVPYSPEHGFETRRERNVRYIWIVITIVVFTAITAFYGYVYYFVPVVR